MSNTSLAEQYQDALRLLHQNDGEVEKMANFEKELDWPHGSASYHIRKLVDAGIVEKKMNGGKAKKVVLKGETSRDTVSNDDVPIEEYGFSERKESLSDGGNVDLDFDSAVFRDETLEDMVGVVYGDSEEADLEEVERWLMTEPVYEPENQPKEFVEETPEWINTNRKPREGDLHWVPNDITGVAKKKETSLGEDQVDEVQEEIELDEDSWYDQVKPNGSVNDLELASYEVRSQGEVLWLVSDGGTYVTDLNGYTPKTEEGAAYVKPGGDSPVLGMEGAEVVSLADSKKTLEAKYAED